MKKKIILLTSLLLLTGCKATYEIDITKETINDKITIKADSNKVEYANTETTSLFTQKLGEWENGHDFYKRELITTADETGYQYTYNFNYNEYDAMSQIRKCYDKFEFNYENGLSILTSNTFLCADYYPQIKNYTIKITSEYNITESNADAIKDNIHTWNITSYNYKNKPIKIKIDNNKLYVKENEKVNNDIIQKVLFIIFFIILIVIFIKRKKNIKK